MATILFGVNSYLNSLSCQLNTQEQLQWNLIERLKKSSPHEINEHDDVIKWKHFPRYWPFLTKPVARSFDVFWTAPGQTAEQTTEKPVIGDAITLIHIMTSL